jgi:hypothetical protein
MGGRHARNGAKFMEQTSQAANGSQPAKSPLEAQLRECFGRVAYAHKTHEKCADICATRLSRIKFWQIVLSAVTTGGLITVLFGAKDVSTISAFVSALTSTMLLGLNAYMKDNDPGQLAERHRKVATELWNIRESYLSLLTDLRSGVRDDDALRARRDELQANLVTVYETAPRTTDKAYAKAQKGLQKNEELTFSDRELDLLLPPALRLTVDEPKQG